MNQNYTDEANKLTSAGAWLQLLEISTPVRTIRYNNGNSYGAVASQLYITWGGNQYWSIPFSVDDVEISTDGRFPEYKVTIEEPDPTSNLRTDIATYDGLVGRTVRMLVVHSGHLSLTTAAVDELAEILGCELTAKGVTFTIGIPSLLGRRFPRDRYLPTFCRHIFGDAFCKYVQPAYSLTSSQVRFVTGSLYNTIAVDNGGLLTSVFDYADGERICLNNLITNGGFENASRGSLTGWSGGAYIDNWSIWGNLSSTQRRWSVDRSKYDTHSYYHTGYNANQGIQQTISGLGTYQQYTLACWVYVVSSVSIRMMTRLRISATGTSYPSVYATVGAGWHQITKTITLPLRNSGELTIFLGGEGAAYFDGVSVVAGASVGNFDRIALDHDTGFTISGSNNNDGFFLADSNHPVTQTYVRTPINDDADRDMTNENSGNSITVEFGYSGCDHTLDACKIRDNTANFGGSPGMKGGVYG